MDTVVMLASGASSRFWPLAQDRHKTLYPVYRGRTIFRMTLEGLLQCGFQKAIITAKPRDIDRMRQEIPESIEAVFVAQESTTGQGDAILTASARITDDAFYVIGADKIFGGRLLDRLRCDAHVTTIPTAVFIATTPTKTPSQYGVVETVMNGAMTCRVQNVVEKPQTWPDPHPRKIVSAYRLTRKFLEILASVPSEPYSFEKALDAYAKTCDVWNVPVDHIPETTLKYPWHLLELNSQLMQGLSRNVQAAYDTEEGAALVGPVHLEKNVYIACSAVVRGPCVIREGARIMDFALVRENSYIGRDVVVGAHSEVKNSIIYDGTKLHDARVLDSIIGENCNLGAGTRISNSRFNREPVTSWVKGERVSTGLKHFGIVMGKGSRTATLANFMPGVLVGEDCRIGGSYDVTQNVPNSCRQFRNSFGAIETKFPPKS